MRSPRTSASSIKCVVRRIQRLARYCRITFQVKRREKGSMPLVGSSRRTTLLPPQNAIATDSLRFIPPLRFFENVLRFSNKATSLMIWSMCSSASACDMSAYSPFKRAKNRICSRTVNWGKRQSCWRQIPIFWRIPFISELISLPATRALPDDGANAPVSMAIVVVLPAPLCPNSAVTCPLYMLNERLSTACFSPKDFVKPRISIFVPSVDCARSLSDTGSIGISGFASSSVSVDAAPLLLVLGHQYDRVKGKYKGRACP
mmetsp:Transcript_36306/g.87548  ORF Transcript_36306/g.87548 Transcript_36306/m.87548 type:complete len:260 (+) Transcript_36306:4756-5535(+)